MPSRAKNISFGGGPTQKPSTLPRIPPKEGRWEYGHGEGRAGGKGGRLGLRKSKKKLTKNSGRVLSRGTGYHPCRAVIASLSRQEAIGGVLQARRWAGQGARAEGRGSAKKYQGSESTSTHRQGSRLFPDEPVFCPLTCVSSSGRGGQIPGRKARRIFKGLGKSKGKEGDTDSETV